MGLHSGAREGGGEPRVQRSQGSCAEGAAGERMAQSCNGVVTFTRVSVEWGAGLSAVAAAVWAPKVTW